jgi:hypothetical protein
VQVLNLNPNPSDLEGFGTPREFQACQDGALVPRGKVATRFSVTSVRLCGRFLGLSSLGASVKQLLVVFFVFLFYVSPLQPQKPTS